MKFLTFLFLISAILTADGAALAANPAPHYKGYQLAPLTRVTLSEARRLALLARDGVVTNEELQKESGGSGLRYSFDIKSGDKTFEVDVDAQTGTILENKAQGPHPD